MAATLSLLEALNQGISSGNLIDTKVILYSHRDSLGRVCRPKALYANSHVLKTVPYFNDLLFGDFAESQSRDFKDAIDEGEFAEDYGYLSDSDLEDDEEERSLLKHTSELEFYSFDLFQAPGEESISWENYEEKIEEGKVVKIPDMAFVTFQAFLMYLYTDVVEFASFGSKENRESRSAEIVDPSDNEVPRPSPKSIYRLADKYDVSSLKALALDHIRDGLESCDIVEETFSKFASQYDEVRNLYIRQLAFDWMDDSTVEIVRTNVGEKISSFAEGDLDRAMEIISELLEIASTDEDITITDTDTPDEVERAPSPIHWPSVRTALIGSVRTGIFFDRKYWARHSKAGHVLKPVYLSSTIMKEKAQQLDKLVKYLKKSSLMSDLEGDVNVESDCEGGSPGESLKTKEEVEEKTRAVFTTGSFSAWKSLFFYFCTDAILFAPLKSQGFDSRSNYVAENTVGIMPPPCSPKSIYILANLLEIPPLCERALADIKTKVSSDNVVDELFSWVTAGQKEIMEMQCDLLVPNLKNPEIIALVKENVRQISDGSSPHRAGALNLVLDKAFEFKKQGRGVKLRCRWNCSRAQNLVSYSYCPQCNRGYMVCVGCGYIRSGHYSSCQGCGKRFI